MRYHVYALFRPGSSVPGPVVKGKHEYVRNLRIATQNQKTNASFADCAVCSSSYGRGVANACHLCTETFKGCMYFVLAVALLITIVVVALLAVYLVSWNIVFGLSWLALYCIVLY